MSEVAPITFNVNGDRLLGLIHHSTAAAKTGVIILVGGPQYRIGAHRQYVHLARHLAAAGIPVMRFDYRGVGDSEGNFRGFETVDHDIAAAIDTFRAHIPRLEKVVLWGLCEGASAILLQQTKREWIGGMVLVNPWVRTEEGLARAYVKHYYIRRFFSGAFWHKLLTGRFAFSHSLKSLGQNIKEGYAPSSSTPDLQKRENEMRPFPARMADGFRQFSGAILIILSDNDLTAREFEDHAANDPTWRNLMNDARVTVARIARSDHTFSRETWRHDVARITRDWLLKQDPTGNSNG